jgi:hypothetical protein
LSSSSRTQAGISRPPVHPDTAAGWLAHAREALAYGAHPTELKVFTEDENAGKARARVPCPLACTVRPLTSSRRAQLTWTYAGNSATSGKLDARPEGETASASFALLSSAAAAAAASALAQRTAESAERAVRTELEAAVERLDAAVDAKCATERDLYERARALLLPTRRLLTPAQFAVVLNEKKRRVAELEECREGLAADGDARDEKLSTALRALRLLARELEAGPPTSESSGEPGWARELERAGIRLDELEDRDATPERSEGSGDEAERGARADRRPKQEPSGCSQLAAPAGERGRAGRPGGAEEEEVPLAKRHKRVRCAMRTLTALRALG